MTLAWLPPARHAKKRSDKAPQRQCVHDRSGNGFAHSEHHYEDGAGLIWWCQGRGGAR